MNKSICLHKGLQEPLKIKLEKWDISFSSYINQLIENDLKKNIIAEKRISVVQLENILNMKEKIQKYLYKVFWKSKLTDDFTVNIMLSYLNKKKELIEQYSNSVSLTDWINKQIILIQSLNFEQLDCDIVKRDKNLVMHLKMKYGKKFGDIE